jgi:hypothetical protein
MRSIWMLFQMLAGLVLLTSCDLPPTKNPAQPQQNAPFTVDDYEKSASVVSEQNLGDVGCYFEKYGTVTKGLTCSAVNSAPVEYLQTSTIIQYEHESKAASHNMPQSNGMYFELLHKNHAAYGELLKRSAHNARFVIAKIDFEEKQSTERLENYVFSLLQSSALKDGIVILFNNKNIIDTSEMRVFFPHSIMPDKVESLCKDLQWAYEEGSKNENIANSYLLPIIQTTIEKLKLSIHTS